MTLLHAVLLGLIQGVAEFLPISSSGHLAIAEHLLGQTGAAEIPGHPGGRVRRLLAGYP